jgi:hypothetical protein
MVDLGGVVGAVSLALQVVQGLTKYYTQLKSHNDDVKNVLSRTRRLESILSLLQRTVRKLDLDDDPISEETRDCIEECLSSIKKLDLYRRKCCHAGSPGHILGEMGARAQTKLAYPFRKATLDGIQVEMDRTLGNLMTILQVLQM